jgi:hypothetical protein
MEYTQSEIEQIVALCRELLNANEELNARIIAMNAKLENEERKVKRLIGELYFLQNPSKYTA